MLVPLWGIQELNAHICMELPACCVWLPLEPQLEWKHQTSWQTFHTTTGWSWSQQSAGSCWLLTACHVLALSCALHTRAAYLQHASGRGEPNCNFWIYAGVHVPSLRFWARVGRGRSQQLERHSTRERSEVNSPRPPAQHLFLCARHKNATRDLCIRPALSPRFRV